MSLREHVSLREHACVSSRGAQSTELVWILDFKQILLLLLLLLCDRLVYWSIVVDSCLMRWWHTSSRGETTMRREGLIGKSAINAATQQPDGMGTSIN